MFRPNKNQLYSYYVTLLIPTEYLQYLQIILTISGWSILDQICKTSFLNVPFNLRLLSLTSKSYPLHSLYLMNVLAWFSYPIGTSFETEVNKSNY